MAALLAVAAVLAATGGGRAGGHEVVSGDHEVTLVHRGVVRHYLLHVSARAALDRLLPVVIALHAAGSSAARLQHYTGLDRVADREGFAVVYPEGRGDALLSWNAGDCCGEARARGADDVGFVVRVLRDVARRVPADRTRVYAVGHSNGAMLAHRLAADRAPRIAAIAAVAGVLALDHFAPARPVPVLHIHSVDDARELYGEEFAPPFPVTTTHAHEHPVEFELARWAERDGCRAQPRTAERRIRPAAAGRPAQTATRLVHAPCTTATEVQLWKLTGSGHGWPGADSRLTPSLGAGSDLIDAAEEAWAFLRRFARPDAPPL